MRALVLIGALLLAGCGDGGRSDDLEKRVSRIERVLDLSKEAGHR